MSVIKNLRYALILRKFLFKRIYLLLLIPLFFIAYPLSGPGIPISVDFPSLDTVDASSRLWTWIEKGSFPGLEVVPRFPIIGLWYILGFLGISSALISKFMVIMGFFIASFSFYFSFVLLFKHSTITEDSTGDTSLKIAAVIGAIFFAYNHWSFERIPHWYFWIGYTILPLFFISIVYAFRNPRNWKYIASSIFLWSFSSTTPHMTVFYGMIFVIIFASFIIKNVSAKIRHTEGVVNIHTIGKTNNKKNLAILGLFVSFLSIFFLYALVNIYWIYPYFLSSQIRSVSPNYLFVEENLEDLSRNSNFLNAFILFANWKEQPIFDTPAEGTLFYYVWLLTSLALPIFGFSALIISREFIKYTSLFSVFALVGIILVMGTQSPINYFKTILENPLLTNFGWLLRDPDKWGFLVAFTYSFLIGISSYKILGHALGRRVQVFAAGGSDHQTEKVRDLNRKKMLISVFFSCLLLGSISLYSYPSYLSDMLEDMRVVPLPEEFDKLNSYLSDVETDNVYFLPYPNDETNWNKINPVGNIYQTYSLKPSIETSGSTGMAGMESRNYYNYLARSIIENRTKDIRNFIYPLGTSYLIFHNDTWNQIQNSPTLENLVLLDEINSLEGLHNEHNEGFYNIFKVDSDRKPQQVSIPKDSIAAVGGLETLQSLYSLQPFFSSLNSSVFFVDEPEHTDITDDILNNSAFLILGKSDSYYDLIFSLIESKYMIDLSKFSVNHNPLRVWSKAGATDPIYGFFHSHQKKLGIDNWQFDYGRGLVITQATGANLSVPIDIAEDGEYDVFLRFLKNQKGGIINVYLDNQFVRQINTLDERANFFSWKNILDDSAPLRLVEGEHTITLENVIGFNAVNTFSVVPSGQISKLQERVFSIAEKTGNIHLLEAESSFYNNKGRLIDEERSSLSQPPSMYYLFSADDVHTSSASLPKDSNQNFSSYKLDSILTGQLNVPENADLLSLQLLTNEQSNYYNARTSIPDKTLPSSEHVLKVYPAIERRNIIESDFERNKTSIPLADLRRELWVNHDANTQNTSIDSENPISGNASLRVDVGQGNKSEWNSIATDFIPINDKSYYNFNLEVSAKNVEQLHSKAIYFDENRKRIEGDFIFEGQYGTFQNSYLTSIVPPLGTKYLRFEMLIRPITTGQTSYLIDNMKLDEISPPARSVEHYLDSPKVMDISSIKGFSTSASSLFSPSVSNNSEAILSDNITSNSNNTRASNDNDFWLLDGLSGTDADTSNNYPNTTLIIQKTKPIPVTENSLYNFSISLAGRQTEATLAKSANPGSIHNDKNPGPIVGVIGQFTTTSDVIENTTKYGQNASGGSVLSLSPESEIYTDLDVLKPADYTIALKANTCKDCSSSLIVAIQDKDDKSIIGTETVSLKKNEKNTSTKISNETRINDRNKDYDSNRYNEGELEWLYLNESVYLDKGKYEIKIYSNSTSKIDLDSVVLYSNKNDNKSNSPSVLGAGLQEHRTLDEIFSSSTERSPAYLAEYQKISPTKYEVKVKNATRPYMLSLAETYDPLWTASYGIPGSKDGNGNSYHYSDGNKFKTSSIPLYSAINGFYINKTGDYILTIEYQPQIWFIQGTVISIIATISILVFLIISHKLRSFIQCVKLSKFRTNVKGEDK